MMPAEFFEGLRAVGCPWDQKQLVAVFDTLAGSGRKLHVGQFLRVLRANYRGGIGTAAEVEEYLKRLRTAVVDRGPGGAVNVLRYAVGPSHICFLMAMATEAAVAVAVATAGAAVAVAVATAGAAVAVAVATAGAAVAVAVATAGAAVAVAVATAGAAVAVAVAVVVAVTLRPHRPQPPPPTHCMPTCSPSLIMPPKPPIPNQLRALCFQAPHRIGAQFPRVTPICWPDSAGCGTEHRK